MVDGDRLNQLIEGLGESISSDTQEAREIIKQKEGMINQASLEAKRVKESAEKKAREIEASAEEERRMKIDDSEIVKGAESKIAEIHQKALEEGQSITHDAQRKAYRMLSEADAASETRREGASQYARETLFDLEERLSGLVGQVRKGIDTLGLEADAKTESKASVSSNGS